MTHAIPPQREKRGRAAPAPRGVTLVELLVVMVVLLAITAAAIPVMAPALEGRRVREAARQVVVFLEGARSRARQSGRPVGVVFERVHELPDAAPTLSYAEVPPPWAGSDPNSRIVIANGQVQGIVVGTVPDAGWESLLKRGDLLKLGYQGHLYRIETTNVVNDNVIEANSFPWALIPVVNGAPLPPNQSSPFQIFRAPVKLAAGSLQLPASVAIDLVWSGMDVADVYQGAASLDDKNLSPTGLWGFHHNRNSPLGDDDHSTVMIMFAPGGGVTSVYCWENYINAGSENGSTVRDWRANDPVGPIHLLVGRRDLVPFPGAATPADELRVPVDPGDPASNLYDLNNRWISIQPQSGLITTTELAPPPSIDWDDSMYSDKKKLAQDVQVILGQARLFAREGQTSGGR